MGHRSAWRVGLCLLMACVPLAAGGCDEDDAASVKITLEPDWKGTITASSLVIPDKASPVEQSAKGATWGARGSVVMAKGTFADLSKLALSDITFAYGGAGTTPFLQVSIPRGPNAQWPAMLTVTDDKKRQSVADAIDGRAKPGSPSRIGSTMRIQITVPGKIVTQGVGMTGHGLESSSDNALAMLTIPLAIAREAGEPLQWNITWTPKAK